MLNNRTRLLSLLGVIITVLVFSWICFCPAMAVAAPTFDAVKPVEVATEPTTEPIVELIDTPVTFIERDYKVFYDIDKSNNYVVELTGYIKTLDEAIVSEEYSEAAVREMQDEKIRLQNVVIAVESDITRYKTWEQEHYYAAKTWEFLMQHGYSEAVASGIIGNMMIETSGCTLDLKPTIYSPGGSFYGLCQWSKSRKPISADGSDASFEEQLVYLHEDIPVQFKAFGSAFSTSHEKFLAIKDPAEAALIFAKVYERCGSGSYSARQRAAYIAYEYFTSEA